MSTSIPAASDWRLQLPMRRRNIMSGWFWLIAAMTLAVLIVGGVTRLTHSGLSMVEWDPIIGVIPPISDAEWQRVFEQYQQFPEYQKLRHGMTLHDFKFIFFWEYLHRLLARTIGLVFLLPFVFFLAKRWMNRPLAMRSLALFALGGMQGVMGWLMVASGLVDRPSVSHYRLAAHLSLAFLIFGYAVWLARDMAATGDAPVLERDSVKSIKRGSALLGVLLALQIVWGAFVAGLKAGFFANTFPLMGGRLVPATLLDRQPLLANFFENPTAVQWMHRVIGTILALAAIGVFVKLLRARVDRTSLRYAGVFFAFVMVQYLLGVLTLLHAVPVALGVTHQAMAMIVFGVWVMWRHHAHELAARV
jgi:heme a synthase